jgi:hypothetical protein
MPPQAPSGTLTNPRYPTFYACYLLQSLQIPGAAKIYVCNVPFRADSTTPLQTDIRRSDLHLIRFEGYDNTMARLQLAR